MKHEPKKRQRCAPQRAADLLHVNDDAGICSGLFRLDRKRNRSEQSDNISGTDFTLRLFEAKSYFVRSPDRLI